MTTDNKTLADVQPGGRVRLGNAPWPEIDVILADAYSAGAEGLPFEGIARRAAVRAAVAALSAQPSPSKQTAHCPVKHCGMTYARVPADGRCHACGATVQPSPGGQGDARLLADVDERIATAKALGYEDDIGVGIGLLHCVRAALAARQPVVSNQPSGNPGELAVDGARQPVGEPVARLVEAVEGECDGLVISMATARSILAHVSPAAYAPAAYMVDGRIEQGLFFDRTAAEAMATMNAGELVPLFRSPAQAVDTWAVIERVAKNWDGCSIGPAIRAEAEKVIGQPAQDVDLGLQLDRYDAGLLGDGGGGDVTWWQDYIRAELDRAHEFYQDQADAHG